MRREDRTSRLAVTLFILN